MKVFIIKFLGFLIGFFITIIIINYISINNKKQIIEKYQTSEISTTNSIVTTIQNSENKYMAINSFTDKIKIDENRWYEKDLTLPLTINSINDNKYFTYTGKIELVQNSINTESVKGAKLDGIQLNGPNSYYFANNPVNSELNSFSIYFAGKFKGSTKNNNILFEMIGNTESINYPDEIKYAQSIVSLNLFKNQNNNFDIIITIGNVVYKGLINNIDKAVIINNDVINFYLTYSSTELIFGINKQIYKYSIDTNAFKVKLGSTSIIINKGGNLNMDLYLFVYYKSVISFTDVQQLVKYTYSNLSGLETIVNSSSKCNISENQVEKNMDTKLKEMETNIIKTIEKKNTEIKKDTINNDVEPLKLPLSKTNEKTGFFDWFF